MPQSSPKCKQKVSRQLTSCRHNLDSSDQHSGCERWRADVTTDLSIHGSTTTSVVGNSESYSEPHRSNKQAVNKPSQLPLNTCSLLPNMTKLTDHYPDIPPKILLQNKTICVDHMFEKKASKNKLNCAIKHGYFRQS